MAYKTVRLLNEAIGKEMETLRKLLMVTPADDNLHDVSLALADAQERLNDLRKLVDELAEKASRPAIDEVKEMRAADYVETMKPLVKNFHQQLFFADKLCECLNEDLQADASILMLIGEGKTIVRAAHDPAKEEVALAVETILAGLDNSLKEVAMDAAEVAGQPLEAVPMEPKIEPEDDGDGVGDA